MELPDCANLEKPDLVRRLLQADAEQQGNIFSTGVLEIMTDGYGFLRQISLLPANPTYTFHNLKSDASACATAIKCRAGQTGPRWRKYISLLRIEAVNDLNAELAKTRPYFTH